MDHNGKKLGLPAFLCYPWLIYIYIYIAFKIQFMYDCMYVLNKIKLKSNQYNWLKENETIWLFVHWHASRTLFYKNVIFISNYTYLISYVILCFML